MNKIIIILVLVSLSTTTFAACPAGTTLNKDTNFCEGETTCRYGSYNPDMRMCESIPERIKCPKDTEHDRMTDTCLSEPTCPPATIYDGKRGLCVGIPQ